MVGCVAVLCGGLFANGQTGGARQAATGRVATEQMATPTNEEREALTFTAYDLDVHLRPSDAHMETRARFTLKNTGGAALKEIALSLSSTLAWESISGEVGGRSLALPFVPHKVDTDADHTGGATEAMVTLPAELQAGESVTMTALYAGAIPQTGKRLESIGAPAAEARASDWDEISPQGTALRGFGNVLWYPVAAAPIFLGEGAKLFQEVGVQKRRQADATIALRLAVEYVGEVPDAAFFCGRREPLRAIAENVNVPVADSPGLATAEFPAERLGFRAPSLFVTDRSEVLSKDSLIAAVTERPEAMATYERAATQVKPMLQEWLGAAPMGSVHILDHAGQPFEDDTLLVTAMRTENMPALGTAMVHSLTHAWFPSPQVWLDEGMAQFMSLVWLERTGGRDAALEQVRQQGNTLAFAEPGVGAESGVARQSLIDARDEVFYRTKAGLTLWVLRTIVGDESLKRGIQAYRRVAAKDVDGRGFEKALAVASGKDLGWFFEDWVYHDRGLPDLRIVSVTPRVLPAKGGKGVGTLVAVEVRNDGEAAAEVPVTVRSGTLTATEMLRVRGRSSASTRIVFEGTPDEVLVNDGAVPEMTTSAHRQQIVPR